MSNNHVPREPSAPIVVSDHFGSSAFSQFVNFPHGDLSNVDVTALLPGLGHPGGKAAADPLLSDEWLLIDCDSPGCRAFTEVDPVPADPNNDAAPLREILSGHGWTLDSAGRYQCPDHRLECSVGRGNCRGDS